MNISKEIMNINDIFHGFENVLKEIQMVQVQHDEFVNLPHMRKNTYESFDENFLKMSAKEMEQYNSDLMQFIQKIVSPLKANKYLRPYETIVIHSWMSSTPWRPCSI